MYSVKWLGKMAGENGWQNGWGKWLAKWLGKMAGKSANPQKRGRTLKSVGVDDVIDKLDTLYLVKKILASPPPPSTATNGLKKLKSKECYTFLAGGEPHPPHKKIYQVLTMASYVYMDDSYVYMDDAYAYMDDVICIYG